jgi:hypothetical protein
MVLARLKEKLGFDLRVNSYVSNRSAELMSRCLGMLEGNSQARETDRQLAQRLKSVYLENNCWTWEDAYQWPEYEFFYRIVQPNSRDELRTSASLPMNFLTRKFGQSRLEKEAKRVLPVSVRSHIKKTYRGH